MDRLPPAQNDEVNVVHFCPVDDLYCRVPDCHVSLHLQTTGTGLLQNLPERLFKMFLRVVQHRFQFDRNRRFGRPRDGKDQHRRIQTLWSSARIAARVSAETPSVGEMRTAGTTA